LKTYLDTSVLIASVSPEVETEAALAWLERHPNADHLISDWTLVEVASAIALKERSQQLTMNQARIVNEIVDSWVRDSLEVLPIHRTVFHSASRLLAQSGTRLRAGDALHLAIAREEGATLVTLDRTLANEASVISLPVDVPGASSWQEADDI